MEEGKEGDEPCFFKEDQSEFLGVSRLKDLVKELSEFIGFPIGLYVEEIEGDGNDRFGEKWYTERSSEAGRSFLT